MAFKVIDQSNRFNYGQGVLLPMTSQTVYRNFGKPRFRVNIFLLTIHPDVRLGVQGR